MFVGLLLLRFRDECLDVSASPQRDVATALPPRISVQFRVFL
jgi:hypothetical protein